MKEIVFTMKEEGKRSGDTPEIPHVNTEIVP